jgi:hypothetical protein
MGGEGTAPTAKLNAVKGAALTSQATPLALLGPLLSHFVGERRSGRDLG